MGVGVEVQGDAFVLRIDQRYLLGGMLRRDGGALKQKYDAGIIHPRAQDRVERQATAAQVVH